MAFALFVIRAMMSCATTKLAKKLMIPQPINEHEWPELLTPDQAAALLNITRDQLRRLVRANRIPKINLSPLLWRVRKSDIERIIETGQVGGSDSIEGVDGVSEQHLPSDIQNGREAV